MTDIVIFKQNIEEPLDFEQCNKNDVDFFVHKIQFQVIINIL